MKGKIYAVDLDLTLTRDVSWNEEDALHAEPNMPRIDMINSLYGPNVVVIYTARVESMRHATAFWLAKHGVKYHALVMEKFPADCYIDDKAISDVDFFAPPEAKEDTSVASKIFEWYLDTYGNKRARL